MRNNLAIMFAFTDNLKARERIWLDLFILKWAEL